MIPVVTEIRKVGLKKIYEKSESITFSEIELKVMFFFPKSYFLPHFFISEMMSYFFSTQLKTAFCAFCVKNDFRAHKTDPYTEKR